MTQSTISKEASAPAYDLKNRRNSVGLVYNCALEHAPRKTIFAVADESSKNADIYKNEEPKYGASLNRAGRSECIILGVGAKELAEKTSTRKGENCKNNVAKRASNAKKNQILPPTRVLRSAGKYDAELKRGLKSASDFSVENLDWYYEDEHYYKKHLGDVMSDFAILKENRRQGNDKLYYDYLLLDSRKCRNKANISWLDFIEAIFYIGKGKHNRAFAHAKGAEKASTFNRTNRLKIKEIWDSGNSIKVCIVTENVVAEEAYTREAAMIEAIGLTRLCNKIHSSYYGVAVTMKARERLELGATLLVEARDKFRWKDAVDIYPKKKTEDLKKTADNKSSSRQVRTIKRETDKAEKQSTLEPEDNAAKTTSNAKKNVVLPALDVSIANMDWYYKRENDHRKKLEAVLSDFAIPKKNRREGNERLHYTFLLLDSRECRNKANISWLDFIKVIFYIGKGINDRAVRLVKDAEKDLTKTSSKELFLKIKAIWDSGNPVKVFLVTENIIAEEAFTRSAAMIDAMSLNRLCNERRGSYYEKAATLNTKECLELGATLLVEARDKFRWKQTIDVYPKRKPQLLFR